jgi:two-component system, cell cycle sensor histidine kinase and response regulator CckA
MVKDKDKTKEQLINELVELRRRTAELERSDTQHKSADEAMSDSEARYRGLVESAREARRSEDQIREQATLLRKEVIERKYVETQIREQAALLDKAQDAIAVLDLEHCLIYWNKGAERLYGWIAEETIGKNTNELLYKEESPGLIEAQKSAMAKGEWMGELHQVTKDGKDIDVESRWTLVRDNRGKPKSILIINTDITEKKKLEAQFLRAQRLESVGTLASGIAHDINNVLTPIMLSLELLQERLTDEESQRLLNTIKRSTHRGANLMKQVMSFSKGVEGERIALQVTGIISEIEKIAKETFLRSIEIRTDIPKDLRTISGDATQLHQVVMNLCVNARDAMQDGGILSISAENLLIDEDYAHINTEAKTGPYIVITVSDTGTGIPSEIIDRIFEPFFTTKEHGKGTGLGLSTSLGIVKSHGGFITVYSEVGKGTAFKVYLPAITTPETLKVQEHQHELPAGHGESILVVDDEDRIREITKKTLETNGYKIITANDGKEAIALYMQHRELIKAVLMDMMMPVMDGQASIRAIRKINPEVKIITVSGLSEKDRLASVADDTNAFLPKPYTAEKLLKTIHEVLSAK